MYCCSLDQDVLLEVVVNLITNCPWRGKFDDLLSYCLVAEQMYLEGHWILVFDHQPTHAAEEWGQNAIEFFHVGYFSNSYQDSSLVILLAYVKYHFAPSTAEIQYTFSGVMCVACWRQYTANGKMPFHETSRIKWTSEIIYTGSYCPMHNIYIYTCNASFAMFHSFGSSYIPITLLNLNSL